MYCATVVFISRSASPKTGLSWPAMVGASNERRSRNDMRSAPRWRLHRVALCLFMPIDSEAPSYLCEEVLRFELELLLAQRLRSCLGTNDFELSYILGKEGGGGGGG